MVDIIDPKWTEQDISNTSAAPDGVQGGYAPSTIAPIVRSTRGALKRFYVQNNAIYTSTGAANAYVLTYSGAPAAYSKGIRYAFWANHNNTGAATLNINGLGARSILEPDGSAVLAGQIVAGTTVAVEYDGTNFRLVNVPMSNPSFTGVLTANGSSMINSNGTSLAIQRNGTDSIDIEAFLTGNSATKHAIDLNRYGGAVTINGHTAWHAGNDGAGSGSDMDLLDGQHGSFYQNANNLIAGTVADARLPSTLAGKVFTSQIGAPSYQINGAAGTNLITAGPGDGATWANHNIKFQGWYGMGMYDHAGNVNGVYNFRDGSWETKGGFKVNGQSVWGPWNFDPNSKFNITGGTIWGKIHATQDIETNANLGVNGGNINLRSEGNRHLWFQHTNGTTRGLVYHDNNGSMNIQLYNNGGQYLRRMTFAENGELYVQGNIVSDGNMRIGSSTYQTDGNILFTGGMANLGPSLHQVLGAKITAEGRSYPRRIGGGDINFHWSGQEGQPSWLWGGNDGTNMYVYNPRNFHVRYADNAGWSSGAGNADTANAIIQTLRDVRNERAFNTSYHNNSGRDLYVFAGSGSNGMGIDISSDGQNFISIENGGSHWAIWGIIPRNWYYKVGGWNVHHWYESR